MTEHIAYLGFGSNLGDRLSTLRQARLRLQEETGIRSTRPSFLYQTTPVGGPPDQPDYLNSVLEVNTTLKPLELLQLCQAIEQTFDRQRDIRWGARTLDIDLLVYDDLEIDSIDLQLPHPRLAERGFVLQPLCDLAPDVIHPLLHQTYTALLMKIPPLQGVHRLNELW